MSETTPTSNADSESAATVFGSYLDRLIAGETLDIRQIRAEQPDVSEELIDQLRTFLGLAEDEGGSTTKAFGDYELIRVLGRGGMGIVYEAWQRSLERVVAVKVLPTGVVADPKSVIRFKREAQISAKLRHTNIVSVFEMGVQQDTPYYAMELIDGTPLGQELDRLRDEKESASDSTVRKEYFRQIAQSFIGVADGLHHAHANGITHRDVKPSNLVFDAATASDELPNGELRILDFGLALSDEHQNVTQTGCLVGTVRYMSPEQAAMETSKRIDYRTDIYSLGATLYEAITLTPPFAGRDVHDTLKKIATFDPTAPQRHNSRVPHDLETIILKCMRKRPEDRYQSAKALAQDLERFVSGDPIEARPQSRVERVSRFMERNWRTTLVAVSFVLMAITLAWSLLKPPTEELIDFQYTQRVRKSITALRRTDPAAYAQCPFKLFVHPWGLVRISPGDPEPIAYFARQCKLDSVYEAIGFLDQAIQLDGGRLDAYFHRARARLLLGHVAKAEQDLRRVHEIDPDFGPALYLLHSILDLRGDEEQAREFGNREAAAATRGWYTTWISAQRAFEKWSWESAGQKFQLTLRSRESEPYIGWRLEVRQGLLMSLYLSQLPIQAGMEISALEGEWPDLLELPIMRGALYLAGGNREAAMEQFDAVWERAQDDATRDYIAETIWLQHGLWVQANRLTAQPDRQLIEDWSSRISNGELKALVGYRMHWLLHERLEGEALLRAAVDEFPENPWFCLALANGQWTGEEAYAMTKEAVRRAPELTYALACHAFQTAHDSWSHPEDTVKRSVAEAALARASAAHRQFTWEYVFLGLAHGMLGNVEQAEKLYEEISSRDENPWIEHNWGEMLRRAASTVEENAEERQALLERSLEIQGRAISKNSQFNFIGEQVRVALLLKRLPVAIDAFTKLQGHPRGNWVEREFAQELFDHADVLLHEEHAESAATNEPTMATLDQVASALQLLADRNRLLGRDQLGAFRAEQILEKLIEIHEHLNDAGKAQDARNQLEAMTTASEDALAH